MKVAPRILILIVLLITNSLKAASLLQQEFYKNPNGREMNVTISAKEEGFLEQNPFVKNIVDFCVEGEKIDVPKLQQLFYQPDRATWSDLYQKSNQGEATAYTILLALDQAKATLWEMLKTEDCLDSENLLFHLPLLMDEAILKIATGCWGISKNPATTEQRRELGSILKGVGVSQRSFFMKENWEEREDFQATQTSDHHQVVLALIKGDQGEGLPENFPQDLQKCRPKIEKKLWRDLVQGRCSTRGWIKRKPLENRRQEYLIKFAVDPRNRIDNTLTYLLESSLFLNDEGDFLQSCVRFLQSKLYKINSENLRKVLKKFKDKYGNLPKDKNTNLYDLQLVNNLLELGKSSETLDQKTCQDFVEILCSLYVNLGATDGNERKGILQTFLYLYNKELKLTPEQLEAIEKKTKEDLAVNYDKSEEHAYIEGLTKQLTAQTARE